MTFGSAHRSFILSRNCRDYPISHWEFFPSLYARGTGLPGETEFTRLGIRRQNLEERVNDCGIPWEQTERRFEPTETGSDMKTLPRLSPRSSQYRTLKTAAESEFNVTRY